MSLENNNSVLVQLRPFAHQVGGHTCVLEINSSTICKPFVSKEAWFYENEPDAMKEFTPKYLGQVDVQCDTTASSKSLIACLPCSVAKERGLMAFDPPNLTRQGCKRSRKKALNLANSLIRSQVAPSECNDDIVNCRDQTGLDVWSIQCIERQINRYGFWANNKPQKFIMLENLVCRYDKPCMLDLKMGQRQYGDDSSVEKRKLLEARCAKSTSSSLGFRICGTQVYQETTRSYVVHNKYHGRDLDVDGVENELQFFFSNGACLRRDTVSLTVSKLQKLKSLLETQTTFCFYSCSLLLMYDGSVSINKDHNSGDQKLEGGNPGTQELNSELGYPDGVDVRLIDFAHVTNRSNVSTMNHSDDGILFGLENLISILTSFLQT